MGGMIIQRMNMLTSPPPPSLSPIAPLQGVAALSHLGVIKVVGDDAAKFLHSQLTQDFSLLDMQTARLAAFCTAKGRVQASFIGFKRSATEILLVCSQDILAPTLKRLSMFVMRAKAKLSDASADYLLYGLAGNAVLPLADGSLAPWAKADIGDATVVNLYPADTMARQLWIAPTGSPAPVGDALTPAQWLWTEVRSAVATVGAPVVEAFVPQMLNYESVGGVNFKKGCYPGQEVVARSQFRGTLKRRAFVVHADAPMAAGNDVFSAADGEQPVATVVQAAAAPQGGFDAIISGQLAAISNGSIHLGSDTGPQLQLLPLPYILLDDI